MKKRKYTLSKEGLDKLKITHFYQTDWERRLEIARLRNQGLSFEEIGKRMSCSKQNASEIFNKIKDMSVEELEKNLGKAIARDFYL
jgi:DNA-binding transcriptional MerR regulator